MRGLWCYVNDCGDPERPRALSFDAGNGSVFRTDTRGLIDEFRFANPAVFQARDDRTQLKIIEAGTDQQVPEKEREKIQATMQRLSEELRSHIEQFPALRKQHREQVRTLKRRAAGAAPPRITPAPQASAQPAAYRAPSPRGAEGSEPPRCCRGSPAMLGAPRHLRRTGVRSAAARWSAPILRLNSGSVLRIRWLAARSGSAAPRCRRYLPA
ncbi:MAG: AAA family ATPase [Gammaproteobacteria bacterium]|nr:AAA family ATPase [Gammaproteobacteria bacterium]